MPDRTPELGSLFPFIKEQAAGASHPRSFLSGRYNSAEAWKKAGRKTVFDLLHYRPPRCAPRPEVIERRDMGDCIRERVTFQTTPDIRVPAFILIPKNARFPAPGIVALHDHGAMYRWGKEKICEVENEHPALARFKQDAYEGRSYASELCRRGYVVAAIDAFYFGERRLIQGDPPAGPESDEEVAAFNQNASRHEELVGRTIYVAGFTWAGVMYWDDIRTVDYLLTRKEVDKDRIGCVGLSVGGHRAVYLGGLDERIKASVVVGWMSSFGPMLPNHIRNGIGFTKLVPGLYQHMDYPDVAALSIPHPRLVIHGSRDMLFPPEGVRSAFDKIARAYDRAGVPDRFKASVYDTPHEFNRDMQTEAFAWLDRWLG
ncbi:MAG: acetylxylan esterase [Armatimonadetes bacterium]|nr:acetylxylan esterase [Armatimonadota bacterium]